MTNDTTLYTLSTCTSRYDKDLTLVQMTWGELAERLSRSVETSETLEQYNHMTHEERGNVKDVGGFVGGEVRPDKEGKRRRVRYAVAERQLLTIDIDKVTSSGFWAWWRDRWRYRSLIHSTHSSTEHAWRLRLVVPLSRPVNAVEYEAVGRTICQPYIEEVDGSTYEMERLMYWPSHPADETPIYEVKGGEVLDVDQILNVAGRDPAGWAYGSTEERQARIDAKDYEGVELPDPRTKAGWIGAWCAVHDIDAVMSMLGDTYAPAGKRYKYLAGNGAPGVTVRDDRQYCYSHHSDDPISVGGHAVNSFDLYRVVRYGHLDTDTSQRIEARKSYQAMIEHCMEDEAVNAESDRRYCERVSAFDDETQHRMANSGQTVTTTMTKEDRDAETKRIRETMPEGTLKDKAERLVCSQPLLLHVMREDSNLASVKSDQFAGKWVVTGAVPWDRAGEQSDEWSDGDEAGLRNYLESKWQIKGVTKDRVQTAWTEVMNAPGRQVHAIRDYLDGLEWDGVERLDYLMERALEVPPSDLHRAMVRKTLVAAVARIYEPGYKFDQILVMQGEQGIGKSTLLQIIGRGYVNESMSFDAKSKELMEQLNAVWLVEFSELEGMARSEVTTMKSFLSRRNDTYRPAYGRFTVTKPRQCVFFGSTNESQFLRDQTGNRRFWVLPCKRVGKLGWTDYMRKLSKDPHEVEQIWAEAKERYMAGEPLYLDSDMSTQLADDQEQYLQVDEWEGIIEAYLEQEIPCPATWNAMSTDKRRDYIQQTLPEEMRPNEPTYKRQTVTAVEILNEAIGNANWRKEIRQCSMRIGSIMEKICRSTGEWEKSGMKRFSGYDKQRYWGRVQK